MKIDYDDATLPKDMGRQLELNLDRAVQHGLLDDANSESIVDQYSAVVEEVSEAGRK